MEMNIKISTVDPSTHKIPDESLKLSKSDLKTSQKSKPSNILSQNPPTQALHLKSLDSHESPETLDPLNSSRLSKSSESDIEDNLKSALYTFTKESSLCTSHSQINFDSSLAKTPKINPGGIYESPYFKSKEKAKPEIPLLRTPNANGSFQNLSLQLEIENLRKIIQKQQKIITTQDQKYLKMVEIYEKKIKTLEISNQTLLKQFSNKKIQIHSHSNSYSPLIPTKIHSKTSSTSSSAQNNTKSEILYPNGSRTEIYPNGYKVTYFANHDVKQEHPEGISIYFFAKEQTTKTTFRDGVQVIKFKSGQTEKIFPDGTKEIKYTDGTVKCVFNNGEELIHKSKTDRAN